MRSAVSIFLLPLASCGILFAPGPFPVPVQTDPPGAKVTLRGAEVGITPCTIAMKRGDRQFELTHDQFHKQVVEVGRKGNGWVIANLLILPGIIIDGLAGGYYVINTEPVFLKLAPLSGPPPVVWTRPVAKDPNITSGQ